MRAFAMGAHARQEGLDGVDDAEEVDREDPLPIKVSLFGHGTLGGRHAGIIGQDVNRAELGLHSFGAIGEGIDARHINIDGPSPVRRAF